MRETISKEVVMPTQRMIRGDDVVIRGEMNDSETTLRRRMRVPSMTSANAGTGRRGMRSAFFTGRLPPRPMGLREWPTQELHWDELWTIRNCFGGFYREHIFRLKSSRHEVHSVREANVINAILRSQAIDRRDTVPQGQVG